MRYTIIDITENDKILIIAPHPDDECIGTGGLISAYSDQCEVIVMTDGSRGIPTKSIDETGKIRKREFLKEMELLGGIKFQMLDYMDGDLINYPNCCEKIDFSCYTKIFLPWHDDMHPDHTMACLYALELIQNQNVSVELYEYEVHTSFEKFSYVLDITEYIKKKLELLCIHKSQMEVHDYLVQMEALAKYRACQCGYPDKYFEVYRKVEFEEVISRSQQIRQEELQLSKLRMYHKLLCEWVKSFQDNKCGKIASNLGKYRYKNIAIYGWGRLGQLLYNELKNTEMHTVVIFDRGEIREEDIDIPIMTPEQFKGKMVDVVIVTAIYDFKKIENELSRAGYNNILSLQLLLE